MLLFVFGPFTANASEATGQSDSLTVYFKEGYSTFKPTSQMDGFLQGVKDAVSSGKAVKLEVRAYACPSGSYQSSLRVAEKRARNVADYIVQTTGLPQSDIKIVDTGLGWDMLLHMVEQDPAVPAQAEALDILKNTPVWVTENGEIVGGRKQSLMNLNGGQTYNYLSEKYFPQIRVAVACVLSEADASDEDGATEGTTGGATDAAAGTDGEGTSDETSGELLETSGEASETAGGATDETDAASRGVTVVTPDGTFVLVPEEETGAGEESLGDGSDGSKASETAAGASEEKTRWPNVLLKTNLPYWGLVVPNLAVEFRLADHWSLDIPVFFSPFTVKPDYRFRTFNLQPGVRYWFREDMKGHFLGVHAIGGIFNVAVDDTYRYQDTDGAWGGGIDYGYALAFAKHWGMEFNIGAGYIWSRYDVFYNIENGALRTTEEFSHWGITRVGISLIYKF